SLAPIFFPDPWDSVPHTLGPEGLSPGPHRCFARPRQCPLDHRTQPAPTATAPERNLHAATVENVCGSRSRCRIPWARPSTDIPCVAHIQWPRRSGAPASVSSRPPASVYTFGLSTAVERQSAVRLSPKTRRILPKILSAASWVIIMHQVVTSFNYYLRISSKIIAQRIAGVGVVTEARVRLIEYKDGDRGLS